MEVSNPIKWFERLSCTVREYQDSLNNNNGSLIATRAAAALEVVNTGMDLIAQLVQPLLVAKGSIKTPFEANHAQPCARASCGQVIRRGQLAVYVRGLEEPTRVGGPKRAFHLHCVKEKPE